MTGVHMSRHMTLRATACTVAAILILPGCASSGGGSGSTTRAPDSDVITAEELSIDPGRDLLSAIQSLRPRWLRGRGSATLSGTTFPAVIVDGVNQTSGVLRNIRSMDVEEIRFMNARDATTRYGPGMMGGAILVTRKSG